MIEAYFKAFENKDIEAIETMFDGSVVLQDPVVGKVEGLRNVLAIYRAMFAANDFAVELRRSYHEGEDAVAVEFGLETTDSDGTKTRVDGVDLIEISGAKITSVRAYLDASVGE